jgi:broad specificity phosphatase PhoE
METIKYLPAKFEVVLAPELKELDTGEASHLTVNQLWEMDHRYRYQGLYPQLKYPNGESLSDMLERIARWWDAAYRTWREHECVLIAGHEGTICGILHRLLQTPIQQYPTFNISNCEYVLISVNSDMQIRCQFNPLR